MPCLRMLDAVRKAARWVHIRAQKYTMIPASAKPKAVQPYRAIPAASVQLGATAIRSLATSQIQMYGSIPRIMATADRPSPRKVSHLYLPA